MTTPNVAPTPPAIDTTPLVDDHALRKHLLDAVSCAVEALRAVDRDVDSHRLGIADSWVRDAQAALGLSRAMMGLAVRAARNAELDRATAAGPRNSAPGDVYRPDPDDGARYHHLIRPLVPSDNGRHRAIWRYEQPGCDGRWLTTAQLPDGLVPAGDETEDVAEALDRPADTEQGATR